MAVSTGVNNLARGVLLATVLSMHAAQAAEIKVMTANAIKEAYLEIVAAFEKASGHNVSTVWGGTEGLAKRIRDGEVVDLIIIAAPNIDRLIADGKLATGSRADIAKSGAGIAIRRGLPHPDISTAEAIKQAVLAARSIVYSSGPTGSHLADLFRKMGIADQIKGKVTQPPSGAQVADLLARGEGDLGFQQISELLHAKDVDYLGPLPPEIQLITVYSTGLHAAAPAPEVASALVKYLTAPEAGASFKKIGMDPG